MITFFGNVKRGEVFILLVFVFTNHILAQVTPVENYYNQNHLSSSDKVAFVTIELNGCMDCLKEMPLIEEDLISQGYRVQYLLSLTRKKFLSQNFELFTTLPANNRLISNDSGLYNYLNIFHTQMVIKYNGSNNVQNLFCKTYFEQNQTNTYDTVTIDESIKEYKNLNYSYKLNDSLYVVIDHYYEKESFLLSINSGHRYEFTPKGIDSLILQIYKSSLSKIKFEQLIYNLSSLKKAKKELNPTAFIKNDSEFIFLYKWDKIFYFNDSILVDKNTPLIIFTDRQLKIKNYLILKDTSYGDYYVNISSDNFLYDGNRFIFSLSWLQNEDQIPNPPFMLADYTIYNHELVFNGFYNKVIFPSIVRKLHSEYIYDNKLFFFIGQDSFYLLRLYPFIYKLNDTNYRKELIDKNGFNKFNSKNDLFRGDSVKFYIEGLKVINKNIYIVCFENGERKIQVYDTAFNYVKTMKINRQIQEGVFDFDKHGLLMIKQEEERTILYKIPIELN